MENSFLEAQTENYNFDTSGGISKEEQQEILDKINALSVEKSIIPQEELPAKAKKNGLLFPLAVNLAAVLILTSGLAALFFVFQKDDQEIREAASVLNLTEMMLIQEIRRETNRQLEEKENEINVILSRLDEAGAEYQELQLSIAYLTDEQMERAFYLLRVQDEYRNTLSVLQNEKTNILEDSRLREINLRHQAEEREPNQNGENPFPAMDELFMFSSGQERTSAVQAALGGFYKILDNQLTSGFEKEAAQTIIEMRNFLSNPLFSSSVSLENIRQNNLTAVSLIEKFSGNSTIVSSGDMSENEEKLSVLEKTVEEQERTINALISEGTNQGSLAASYEQSIAELRNSNSVLERSIIERDASIQSLRSDNSEKDSLINEIRENAANIESQNAELTRRNGELQNQIESIRQLLQNNSN